MKKILCVLIAFITLCAPSLTACAPEITNQPIGPDALPTSYPIIPPPLDGIPEPESYGKSNVNFSDMVYTRPDTAQLLTLIKTAHDKVLEPSAEYGELSELIKSVSETYAAYLSATTYLTVMTSRDSSSDYYRAEYALVSEARSEISDALDDLFSAIAASPHAYELEKEHFYEGFCEDYADGERISERAAALMLAETKLENEYMALSPATVTIFYDGRAGSYYDTCEYVKEKYASNKELLERALAQCERLYNDSYRKRTADIFVELVRVRRLIADELGYESYTDYAYDAIYHDYSPEDMAAFTENVAKYIVPVYARLENKVFYGYFTKTAPFALDTSTLTETFGGLLRATDRSLAGIYGYMEKHSLIDVAPRSKIRDSGAFTTYFHEQGSPFIFMSANGISTDYSTLAHEFGHFADSFLNDGEQVSIDLHEISSQSLELLSLDMLDGALPESEYRYLKYSAMRSALTTLVYQTFYSTFEHMAYALPYDEITLDSLNSLVSAAAESMGLPPGYYSSLSYVLIDHTLLYPHYVQSYAVSLVPSLEMYFKELTEDGAGFAAYLELLRRDGSRDFITELQSSGLSYPFDEGVIMNIANKIHFLLLGSNYFTEKEGGADQANAA